VKADAPPNAAGRWAKGLIDDILSMIGFCEVDFEDGLCDFDREDLIMVDVA